jgi:hypothetical protein
MYINRKSAGAAFQWSREKSASVGTIIAALVVFLLHIEELP